MSSDDYRRLRAITASLKAELSQSLKPSDERLIHWIDEVNNILLDLLVDDDDLHCGEEDCEVCNDLADDDLVEHGEGCCNHNPCCEVCGELL